MEPSAPSTVPEPTAPADVYGAVPSSGYAPVPLVEEPQPVVGIELFLRPGFGWATYDTSAPIVSVPDGGTSGMFHFGLGAAIREARTGLGGSLGWAHTFQGGLNNHYGTHTFEIRVSESLALVSEPGLRLALLLEAGAAYFVGGGSSSCSFSISSSCTPLSIDVNGAAFVSAVGAVLELGVFLVGLELDYRYLAGASGPLVSEHQIVPLVRVGLAFDV